MRLKKILYSLFITLIISSCGKEDDQYTRGIPDFGPQTIEVAEDISDTELIGNVIADDPNGDLINYKMTVDNSNLFTLSSSGELSLQEGKQLDYETAAQHQITVRVTDGKGEFFNIVTIKVLDVVEPPQMEDQSFTVSEDISDTDLIGVVVAEIFGGNVEFSIVQNDNDLFEITTDGQLSLADGQTLDYEIATQHQITIAVSDGINNPVEAMVSIQVENVIGDLLNDPASFKTTWQIPSDGFELVIGTNNDLMYDFSIDWGDGGVEEHFTNLQESPSHIYEAAGVYTIAIQGDFPALQMENSVDLSKQALLSIDNWGAIHWQSMHHAFYECGNMTYNATDIPNLSEVKSMSGMFYSATSFNADLDEWDVSNVTDMSQLFYNANAFNGAIGSWDVSNVTDMSEMFFAANIFNQDIGNWDVGNVKTLEGMLGFTPFNQYIGNWNVSSVENMRGVFGMAANFNQNIGAWDVSNVTDMSAMFSGATSFNQNIGGWIVSNVTEMGYMFFNAKSFNQDIGNWDVSNVTTMWWMFNSATAFDQNLGSWNIGNVTTMTNMLNSCGMSTDNFNATILAWHTYAKDHNGPTGIALGATGLVACGIDVYTAAFSLDVDYGWEISGATFLENCN